MSKGQQKHQDQEKQAWAVDTNFFISGFGKNPKSFHRFVELFPHIGWVVSDFVFEELRWYLRSQIGPHLEVIDVDKQRLSKFEDYARRKVGSLPQTPDVSVILLARDEKLPIVSSDLKLVRVARKLGIDATMNSAFLLEMLEHPDLNEEKTSVLQSLRDLVLRDEIAHSVDQADVYDPVIRIKEIMNSSLRILRDKAVTAGVELDGELDTPIEVELHEYATEIRTDLSNFMKEFENGNLELLEAELEHVGRHMTDLMVDLSMHMDQSINLTYRQARTTLAYVLYILVQTYLSNGKLTPAATIMDRLALIAMESPAVLADLEMEIHVQRIRILLLTSEFRRLEPYFSVGFFEKATEAGEEYSSLMRTLASTSFVLKDAQLEPSATVNNVSEIEFLLHLSYLFAISRNFKRAMLTLAHAAYAAANAGMAGMAVAAFEEMIPLYLADPDKDHLEIMREIDTFLTEKHPQLKEFGLMEKVGRFKENDRDIQDMLTTRAVKIKSLKPEITSWMTVLRQEHVSLKRTGRATLIIAVEWNTSLLVGILDKEMIVPKTLGFGAIVRLTDGKVRCSAPSKTLRERFGVDLVLSLAIGSSPKLALKNLGRATMVTAARKIEDYDL